MTEITFVCDDVYYVTVKIEDLLNYPIILALAKDNKPIQRDQGRANLFNLYLYSVSRT
ncbi:hypothetical protein [Cuspidothrix issatschenkoi]|uniref:hypothetical protein n=1 Tax=Cuspidothrix issatschenkoi TaxID=230752 RepID=UPI001A9CA2CE|nr:hypothetical protein [Cuspidothrix issatschenkoi]